MLQQLETVLSLITSETAVSCGGEAHELPSAPGLLVGGRPVALPVDDIGLKLISSLAVKSPHGKGRRTVLDPAVRSSRELQPQQFTLEHPRWSTCLQLLAQRGVAALSGDEALAKQVAVTPYKLLLYSPGDHFVVHRDTEKEPGMFATLIVQLPSRCKGGILRVIHGSETHEYDFGQHQGTSPFQCYFACHFADVEHEVIPLTEGHRLALVYSLCWTSTSPCPIRSSHVGQAPAFTALLHALQAGWPAAQPMAAIALEHQYTTEGLTGRGLAALKGQDGVLGSLVQRVNAALPLAQRVRISIVQASRSEVAEGSGGGYYGSFGRGEIDWEVIETDDSLLEWYTENGEAISSFRSGTINWDSCVVGDPDEFWGDGDSDVESYTGNAGPTKTTTYHRFVLLLWPLARDLALCRSIGGVFGSIVCLWTRAQGMQADSFVTELLPPLKEVVASLQHSREGLSDSALYLLRIVALDPVRLAPALSQLLSLLKKVPLVALSARPECHHRLVRELLRACFPTCSAIDIQSPVVQAALDLLRHWASSGLSDQGASETFARLVPDSLPRKRRLELAALLLGVVAPALARGSAESALLQQVAALVPTFGWEAMEPCFLAHIVPLGLDTVVLVAVQLLRLQQVEACRSLLQGHRPNWAALSDNTLIGLLTVYAGIGDIDSIRAVASTSNVTERNTLLAGLLAHLPAGSSVRKLVMEHLGPPLLQLLNKQEAALTPSREVWRMPHALTNNHPALQAFLRGPLQTWSFSLHGDRKHATNLARKYTRPCGSAASSSDLSGFSAVFTSRGDTVEVRKTPAQRLLEEQTFRTQQQHFELLRQKLAAEGIVPCEGPAAASGCSGVPGSAVSAAAAPTSAPARTAPPPAPVASGARKRPSTVVIDLS